MVSLLFLSPLYRVYVFDLSPTCVEDGLVESGLLAMFFTRLFDSPFGRAVMFLIGNPSNTAEILEHPLEYSWSYEEEVIADIGDLPVVAANLLHSLPPVGRNLSSFLARRFWHLTLP